MSVATVVWRDEPKAKPPEGATATSERPAEPAPQAAAPAVAAPASEPRPAPFWPAAATGGAVGAIAGAVAGIAALLLYSALNPPADPRLDPLAERVSAVRLAVDQLTASVGRTEVSLAQSVEADSRLSRRIDDQQAAFVALEKRLAEGLARQKSDAGIGSPVFGVAVAQLRLADLSGQPYATELLNVSLIAQHDPRVTAPLQALAGSARTGTPTLIQLRQQLLQLGAAGAAQASASESYYSTGISWLSRAVGYAPQPSEADLLRQAVTRADGHLVHGDVGAAMAQIAALSGSAVAGLQPWMEQAARRLAVEQANRQLGELLVALLSERSHAGKDE
ncbi:MAG: hypothetical protein U1E53_10515 [Dongiaceae bacterium]